MSSESVIEVRGLSKAYQIYASPRDRLRQLMAFGGRKHYREHVALQDLSFAIGRGETLGVIGRNGAGKSTLLQLICGTLAPSTGSIEVRGRVAALLELTEQSPLPGAFRVIAAQLKPDHATIARFVERHQDALAGVFGEVLDGRNAHLADGVRRALGREARDFGDYVRHTAAAGAWDPEGAKGLSPEGGLSP